MASIGPQVPAHLLNPIPPDAEQQHSESYPPELPPQAGPQLPPHLASSSSTPPRAAGPQIPLHPPNPAPPPPEDDDREEEEDAYLPALPPDLAAPRSAPAPAPQPKRTLGPALPPRARAQYDSDSDDEVGPMPLPAGAQPDSAGDAVREFMAREERRRKADEEARKPKKLEREAWMLVPPTNSGVLGSLDPTKLKARQFSRSAAPAAKAQDSSLWTETPAERQARLKDEVDGKRKRATDVADEDADEAKKDRKRSRHDAEVKAQVEEFNKNTRAHSLVDMHKSKGKDKDKDGDGPPGIWDHARDMSVGGRLMDDGQRSKMITEARGLGDRFGKGKSGGWL